MAKESFSQKQLEERLTFMYGNAWRKNPAIYITSIKRNIREYNCCECGRPITEDEYIEYGQCCESCHNYWLNH